MIPQVPDWVGGDGGVPRPKQIFPARSVSHRLKDHGPVFTPSSLAKESPS